VRTPWKDYGRYGTVGIELLVWMALGDYGGRALDARLGAGGWVTFLGFIFGVGIGFRSIFKTAELMRRQLERDDRAARDEHDDGG
jgi:F0F1-type ATP synthase assembly protein I